MHGAPHMTDWGGAGGHCHRHHLTPPQPCCPISCRSPARLLCCAVPVHMCVSAYTASLCSHSRGEGGDGLLQQQRRLLQVPAVHRKHRLVHLGQYTCATRERWYTRGARYSVWVVNLVWGRGAM